MRGELDADGLIAAAGDLLENGVAPALSGDARFRILMALSALRMAERERALAVRLEASEADVLAASGAATPNALRDLLRSDGRLDPRLRRALLADAALRTSVTKPGALTEAERQVVEAKG